MPTLTPYDGADPTQLTAALLAPSSGITIVGPVVVGASALEAINFYDDPQATALGIGSGLLLTSGTTPGFSNTMEWFGQDNGIPFYNGDADIDAVVNTVFQTQSYDATSLSFDFTVADSTATSVSFDLVFGSDEFPEWVDQFVDCAIVMVNGVNYALFNHDPLHPLSVISSNLAAGYFQDNAGNSLPIEYDGVSKVLKIVAPIIPGAVNHIKIGIADTGDHILDSGIFIANLSAGTTPGSGVVNPITCDDNSNDVSGTAQDEYFDLKGGDDIAYAGAGDDIVVAGAGNDTVYGGSGNDQLKGDAGDDILDGGDDSLSPDVGDAAVYAGAWNKGTGNYSVVYNDSTKSFTVTDSSAAEGTDTLTNVEFVKFSDGLFTLLPGGLAEVVPVTPPSNKPGTVVITGVGSEGKTLTATVSDPDGIAGAVSYQWQSSDNGGVTWSDIGTDSNTYTVMAADVGKDIQVVATYTDAAAIPVSESPVSAPKTILQVGNGDLIVTLMQLDAPAGATVINPITTLVQDAIELGLSPNAAAAAIKAVLMLPDTVNLQTYEVKVSGVYPDMQIVPDDATALAYEMVSVQVAILTSLSDDDSGSNLTLKILEAAANNQTLDLADANDLATILGIDISGISDPNAYPQPLREIFDRNKSMADAIKDGEDVNAIEKEWQDLLSIQDQIDSTSITDLSIHVNQAPTGFATAELLPGVQDMAYTIDAALLLAGFSDADGGTLAVADLKADFGDVTDNLNGTFEITPNAGYAGPMELTYEVVDGQGGSAAASQMFVVANVEDEATGTLSVAGTVQEGATISADITGITDPDGSFTTTYQWQTYDSGSASWQNIAGATTVDLVIPGDQSYVGKQVRVAATTTDGFGGTTDFTSTAQTVANVEDEATGTLTITGTAQAGATIGADTSGISDPDGGFTATYQWQTYDSGSASWQNIAGATTVDLVIPDDQSYVGKQVRVAATTTDGFGGTTDFTSTAQTVGAGVGVTLVGTRQADSLIGSQWDDSLSGLGGNDNLSGLAGDDVMDGGAGADTMLGGAGDDTYYVEDKRDRVIETTTEPGTTDAGGIDSVLSSATWTLGAFVENLTLTGTRRIDGTGNVLDNVITGNDGRNDLRGGDGNDTLAGGGGADTLTGDAGADYFVFDAFLDAKKNVDKVIDFDHADDTIVLSPSIFTNFSAPGPIGAENFGVGTAAATATQYLIYDDNAGTLYYDADGSGAGAAVAFAILVGAPAAIDYTDFLVGG